MFAVISWNSKNGVTLDREELEVKSSAKYVIMNGGRQEVGAAVSMLFWKDIWEGIIQSIHGKSITMDSVQSSSDFGFIRLISIFSGRIRGIKTEFMRGPGRCDTSHLSDFNETWSK